VLDYLRIRGLALLDDVALDFSVGMNVLTGETGAGKSIIVDALTLLRGGRGRAELVREGEDSARVEAQFSIGDGEGSRLRPKLERHGLALEDQTLVVERRVRRSGRGRSALQSNLTTLTVLSEIGGELLEICSQHEHHSLTHVARHLDLLDAYAAIGDAVDAYAEHYRRWRELSEQVSDIRDREAERLQRADYLRFQIEELERVAPEPGEHEQLRERLALLRESHKIGEFAVEARLRLYEHDSAIASQLAVLLERARRLPQGLAQIEEIAEQLEAAQIASEEAAGAAARLADAIEVGPGELERTEERVHELERLRRKHGCDVDELLERSEQMREELDGLDSAEDQLTELEREATELRATCVALADGLHERREAAGDGLAQAIAAELEALHIPNARLAIELGPLEGGELLGPRGRDRAEIRFSANPGEPLAALNKVASGGELSRVLLAVKSVLSTDQRVATYVFDEVDAGVGGAVAESIGHRLQAAASSHQVLCITHLPQIAAFADTHFRVQKEVVEGRTVTRVVRLNEDQRIEELARMLGGERVTQSAREHAKALIAQARDKRGRAARGGKGAKGKKSTKGTKKPAAGRTKTGTKPKAKLKTKPGGSAKTPASGRAKTRKSASS